MTDLGLWVLGDTLLAAVLALDGARSPADPATAPTFRTYGPDGLMANGTGSLSKLDNGTVTGATNASPIVITAAAHGLTTGSRVVIAAVGGNTSANGSFNVTRIDANTFSLDGSTGNGPYTSGGTWHVAGLYQLSLSLAGGDGYEQGQTYQVVVSYTISAVAYSEVLVFTVS